MTDQPFRPLQIRNPVSVIDMCSAQVLRFLLTRGNRSGVVKPCQCNWHVMSNLQDSCASAVAPTVLEKAYQFGLTRNSHMSFAFDDTKVRERYACRINHFILWYCLWGHVHVFQISLYFKASYITPATDIRLSLFRNVQHAWKVSLK